MTSVLAGVVYLLGASTCAACALLLARGYKRSRVRLLMWSAFCFAALSLDNITLFVDLITPPHPLFTLVRHGATLVGLAVLMFGLIWDSE